MANIHMMMQGKGGVGKSVIAAILAQYAKNKNQDPLCIDTDPVNSSFHGYTGLDVKQIAVMENHEINPRKFDALIDLIAPSSRVAIIDNGASAFVPLSHYLISNHISALLTTMGHQLVIHSIITGGQALLDTINGFVHVIDQFPGETVFVVWLNPYWGPIEHDGKNFEQMKGYLAHKERVSAIVQIPPLHKDTFGRDLSDMLQRRLTFDEALGMNELTIMTRQRLKMMQRQLFDQLDVAMVL